MRRLLHPWLIPPVLFGMLITCPVGWRLNSPAGNSPQPEAETPSDLISEPKNRSLRPNPNADETRAAFAHGFWLGERTTVERYEGPRSVPLMPQASD
jgi:hypothetical protein